METPLDKATPAQIDDMGFEDENGEIETRLGVVLGLHWAPRESRAHRLGALRIVEEYVDMFPNEITNYEYISGPRKPPK